jgi:hypothetical protein
LGVVGNGLPYEEKLSARRVSGKWKTKFMRDMAPETHSPFVVLPTTPEKRLH